MHDPHQLCARNEALVRQAKEHQRILREAAERELREINAELNRIRPADTLLNQPLAQRYTQLVQDRALLLRHISS